MSCFRLILIVMILFFFLLLRPSASTLPPIYPRNHRLNHRLQHPKFRSCDSFSRPQQRSLCFQLQRVHNFRPFLPSLPATPPPPPSELNEIDPRYGVEKRLVPSGPNPLHN